MMQSIYALIETYKVKLIFHACLSINKSISIFKTIHHVTIRVPRQVQKHKDHRAHILKAIAGSSDITTTKAMYEWLKDSDDSKRSDWGAGHLT